MLCSYITINMTSQEGVFAMVIHLREVEQNSYFIGNKISIPVTDILSVVQAPPRLLRRTDDSTLLPLTSSVRDLLCSILCLCRNTASLQLPNKVW